MRSRYALAAMVLSAAAIPGPAIAQAAAPRAAAFPDSWQPLLPPSQRASPSGIMADTPVARAVIAAPAIGHGGRKQAVALMLVGGAGLVTGLLVDESLITIAGAGVAGVGLYLYLR